jgi:hypothetical protein
LNWLVIKSPVFLGEANIVKNATKGEDSLKYVIHGWLRVLFSLEKLTGWKTNP